MSVKYPVIVRTNGVHSYEWLTLAQANERFVVVDNRLTVNNVEPLCLSFCQFLLEQAQKSLLDSQEELEDLCSDIEQYQDNDKRFVLEYLQPILDKVKVDIKKSKQDIDFLTKAFVFLNT